MLKLIDANSTKTILPELDFNSIPPSQVGVLGTRWTHIPLKNSLLPMGPWEFNICSNNKSFINLKKTWIVFTFKITDGNGHAIPVLEEGLKTPGYSPIQAIASSIVRQYTLHINSQMVYDTTVNHAYKTYMENTLIHDQNAKSSSLELGGYRYETIHNDEVGTGHLARRKMTAGGKLCQVAAPVSIDLFNQERLLLNYCDVRLTAYPNSSEFLIEAYETEVPDNYKFVVEDVHLLVQEWDVSDGYAMALGNTLAQEMIPYPLTSVQMRSFFIPENRMDSPVNTLFTTHCPKRVIVGLVDSASFNGNYKHTPFNFQHFNLQNMYLDFSGRTIPSRPMALDYGSDKFAHAYLQMLEGLGYARSDSSNGITLEMFKNGFNFYVFEISPTVHSSEVFDMIRQSNLSLRMEFRTPIPAGGIYAVVLGEFDTILSLDCNRNPHFDSIL